MNKLNIENLFTKRITVDDEFNYKALYNDDRGAVHKDAYKSLIKEAIEKKIITVEKFIIAENIQDELYRICDETKGYQYTLMECLKDYHNESDFVIAPLIYLLRKIDPQFTINTNEEELKIISKVVDVKICPRIDGENATPRLFLPKEKVAISTNDNIENLGDILSVKDVKVYIIATDNRSNIIYAYKVERSDRFFEVSEGYKDRVIAELFGKVREKEI